MPVVIGSIGAAIIVGFIFLGGFIRGHVKPLKHKDIENRNW